MKKALVLHTFTVHTAKYAHLKKLCIPNFPMRIKKAHLNLNLTVKLKGKNSGGTCIYLPSTGLWLC